MHLVGRDTELESLRLGVEKAVGRRAHVIALEGPAGSGKSALLEHLIASTPEFTLLRSDGTVGEQDLPFGSLLGLLRPHREEIERLGDRAKGALLGALALGSPTVAERAWISAGSRSSRSGHSRPPIRSNCSRRSTTGLRPWPPRLPDEAGATR